MSAAVPRIVATLALSSQTSQYGPTTFFTAPTGGGFYRINAYIETADTSGAQAQLKYSTQDDVDPAGTPNFQASGARGSNPIEHLTCFRIGSGKSLTVEIDVLSGPISGYNAYVTLEEL